MSTETIDGLRNIAIIAHVDHGKTTLVDALLQQSSIFRDNEEIKECVMDSNDLERERGITIFSKNASIEYAGRKINIVDTPGHADFGGEVERILQMVDGVLLLVDAFDGPMPQTRFVLNKTLEAGLKVMVVLNKIDRPGARPDAVLDEVFDLFCSLDADDEQLEFPVIYASGRDGYAKYELDDPNENCLPLLDAIIEHIPGPVVDKDGPFQMQVTSLEYNDYVGRICIGKIVRGSVKLKDSITLLRQDGTYQNCRVEDLQIFSGLGKDAVSKVDAGEIAIITGIPEADIYDTITSPEAQDALPAPSIDEPTMTMEFRANDSPFSGREGAFVTSRHLRARLMKELLSNIALRVDEQGESYHVSGRGVMHLSILIENMRREGYEFAVGRPHVIFHEKDGKKMEPIELLTVDVPEEHSGKVMEFIGIRKGTMEKMETRGDRQLLQFRIPSRGLIGLRSRMLNATKGEAVVHHVFLEYEEFKGEVPRRSSGVLVSVDTGPSVTYSIEGLQSRGEFFVPPGVQIYPGMIVGEHCRNEDLDINICKAKKITNVRSAGNDRTLVIVPHRQFSLEASIEYLDEDELLEITPKSLRMRKRILDRTKREKEVKARKKAAAGL